MIETHYPFFRKMLEEAKAATLDDMAKTTPDLSAERMADDADIASLDADQTLATKFQTRKAFYLKKVIRALAKLDLGEYGICESCGEEIALNRLKARPIVDLCIDCKEDQEKYENRRKNPNAVSVMDLTPEDL